MSRRPFSDSSRSDEQLVRQLPALLRQHRPDLMEGEKAQGPPKAAGSGATGAPSQR